MSLQQYWRPVSKLGHKQLPVLVCIILIVGLCKLNSDVGNHQSSKPQQLRKSLLSHILQLPVRASHNGVRCPQENQTSSTFVLSVYFQGGLGNNMFQYASLVGVAHENGLTPVIPLQSEINKIFSPCALLSSSQDPGQEHKKYNEKKGCTFESETLSLGNSSSKMLNGYFQSWRYFKSIEDHLRKEFVFHNDVLSTAKEQLNNSLFKFTHKAQGGVTVIGVHVRLGDIVTKQEYVSYGYLHADKNYLDRAMGYFRQRHQQAVFVVASNDMSWCRKNLVANDVIFLKDSNPREVDMAILSLCNHTVMTTGSFGWWAAWLVGGETVYYKDYPRPNSKLSAEFNTHDYFYPGWIGM